MKTPIPEPTDPTEDVTPTLVPKPHQARLESCVVWFTGLPASGKTTVATRVRDVLRAEGRRSAILDGDVLREGLTSDLGFSASDRLENVRRVAHVAGMMADAGVIVLCALVSPHEGGRRAAEAIVGGWRFFEAYVSAPLEICEQRDPKGLYAKARAGLLPNLTGVGEPYDAPVRPALELFTNLESVDESAEKVLALLRSRL